MKIDRLEIASILLRRMVEHAEAALPEEACGLLFGTRARITALEPARNVAADRRCSFEIEPGVLLRAQRQGRAGGAALVGWYHSHPNGTLAPSLRDAAQAAEEGRLWLIVACGVVGAFRSAADGTIHGRFSPVELDVRQSPSPFTSGHSLL